MAAISTDKRCAWRHRGYRDVSRQTYGGRLDMQAVHREKVLRIRRWIARNSQDMANDRFGCRKCEGLRELAGHFSRHAEPHLIYRSGTLQGRDAKAFQCGYCGQRIKAFRLEGKTLFEMWNLYQARLRGLSSGVSDGIAAVAASYRDRGLVRYLS